MLVPYASLCPGTVTGVKRVGIVGYRRAYIQQQFGWFHSERHLLADQHIIVQRYATNQDRKR